jgi:hypothetical protein
MLGLGKTDRVRASATASSARSRDSYQHYAVALYRQALLTPDDPALAEHVVGDVVTNEDALDPGPERGEDDARHHLAELVFRRCHQLVAGSAQQDRRPGIFGGLAYIRASGMLGIHQRDMTVRLGTVLRRQATSPAAAGEDGDQAGGAAAGGR